jgi:hypothetical protein
VSTQRKAQPALRAIDLKRELGVFLCKPLKHFQCGAFKPVILKDAVGNSQSLGDVVYGTTG